MDQLIPSLQQLVAPFAPCFRTEVFQLFSQMLAAWIVCLGKRSISRVWETTGQASKRNHKAAFRLFSAAAWDWDEVACILCSLILTHLLPGAALWVVVDDTLCHKRGARVAYGGIFLDAVLSSKKHKVFRFGNNWVLLGIVVKLPCRGDRYFCLPLLWRVYEKKGKKNAKTHRTKGQLAAEMVVFLAEKWPTRKIIVVGDSAYVGKHLLKDRPSNVQVLGPIRWDAALTTAAVAVGKNKRGERLPTPKQMWDDRRWPSQTVTVDFGTRQRELRIKVVKDVCWDHAAGRAPLQVVLVRDRLGLWRDEALVSSDLSLTAAEMIAGYCRRWSVEICQAHCTSSASCCQPRVSGYDSADGVARLGPLGRATPWEFNRRNPMSKHARSIAPPRADRKRVWLHRVRFGRACLPNTSRNSTICSVS